jgi:hypothetical protein
VFAIEVMPKAHRAYGQTEMAMAQKEVNVRHRRIVAKVPAGIDPLLRSMSDKASKPETP